MRIYEFITSKLLSVAYRLLLLILSMTIIVTADQNHFEVYWYFIVAIPYLGVYFYTVLKEGIYSIIRLLNDFIFIGFVIYGKTLSFGVFL